jgi:RHS repeat-associated protein
LPSLIRKTSGRHYPSAGSSQPHAVSSSTTTAASGTRTVTYGYDSDGDLTSVTSSAADQTLTWSDNGKLTQIAVTPAGSSTAQDTGFVYDARGNQLVRTDPGAVTLYLSDEELVLSTSTGTVTGTRFYTIGSQQIAELTSSGTGTTDISFLTGDNQGTETVTVDASTLDVTRRWYDPYGNPVGPSGAGFPDGEKGFVGGTADTATGLTDLGAREYQSATGSFISTDSELKLSNPQDLNPYAYALDDPATNSDPTGTSPIDGAQQLSASSSWGPVNTGYGELSMAGTASLSVQPSPGDSIVEFSVTPSDASATVSIPGYGTFTYDDPMKGVMDAATDAAADIPEQEVNAEVNDGATGNYTWADNATLWSSADGSNSVTLNASFTQVSVTAAASKNVGKGKYAALLNVDVTVTFEINVNNPKLPEVPWELEKEMATAVAAAGLVAAGAAVWVALGTAVEIAVPILIL